MFVVSKLYWLLMQPLSLAFSLTLAALAAGVFGFRRLQWAGGLAAATLLFLSLFTTLGALLIEPLESRFPRPAPAPSAGCILVLGGGFENEISTARGGWHLNDSGDRFVEMLRLARLLPEAKILVSGGDGRLVPRFEDDGTVARRLLADFGIETGRLIIEPRSRNTYENAVNSAAIIRRDNLGPCLLVTSAFHMPRAVGMFRTTGVAVIPWPTDYRTDGHTGLTLDPGQPMVNADLLTTALREWSGLAGNYLVGRQESLFPAP